MNINLFLNRKYIASISLVLAFLFCGCGKPAPETPKAAPVASPAKAAEQTNSGAVNDAMDVSVAAVRILHAAHRSGGVILRGNCGTQGIANTYPMNAPITVEPMDKALQEISAKYQNIYWRESPATGVRIADSGVKARLLRVKVREFRIVEDREPDAAIAELWRAPEVAAFIRRNQIRFARRTGTLKRVLSPPMIVEVKNATVGDILDHIAAGYRADPPKVWTYLECAEPEEKAKRKEILIDITIK
jgi:hypothetical protein